MCPHICRRGEPQSSLAKGMDAEIWGVPLSAGQLRPVCHLVRVSVGRLMAFCRHVCAVL